METQTSWISFLVHGKCGNEEEQTSPILKVRDFDCQTTSLLAFCLQGPGSPGETQLLDFTAVFPNYVVFWDVPLNPEIPSARAKFLSVNHYFQSSV